MLRRAGGLLTVTYCSLRSDISQEGRGEGPQTKFPKRGLSPGLGGRAGALMERGVRAGPRLGSGNIPPVPSTTSNLRSLKYSEGEMLLQDS